ncbi:MAG TPA: helix-turn-helix domain-containing protein [Acidimicrobiia bacterium]|jgi:transcriptional regulator with XRE-family HTH domain
MSVLFGDIVRRGRERAGLSQARVAQLIGKSASTVRAWEQGRSKPADRQAVSALAAVLGLNEHELLDHAGFERLPDLAPRSVRDELSALASERAVVIPVQTEAPTPVQVDRGPRHLHGDTETASKPRHKVVPDSTTEAANPTARSAKVTAPKVTTVGPPVPRVVATSNVSYIEDEEQKGFYRRRAVATAVVLVVLVIVLWWSLGRTGGAIGEFIRSFFNELNI